MQKGQLMWDMNTRIERWLAKKVAIVGTCWQWTGSKTGNGYGQSSVGGKVLMAHRTFYEHFKGTIPEGLDLDHLCKVRCCVNPDHLEPVTRSENLYRSDRVGKYNLLKTHCPRDHEYTPENTRRTSKGGRACRACERVWAQAARNRKRAGKRADTLN